MIRVVKVGGSLLTWSESPAKLGQWLASQPKAFTVMLAGGGPWTELLRHATARFDLSEPAAHLMSVQAMSVTATLLANLHHISCERSLANLQGSLRDDGLIVFDVQAWLLGDGPVDLPQTWEVTSDSIAARLAVELQADELVLLKSCEAASSDLSTLAEMNYVDPYFPTIASELAKIRYVSLRS